MRTSFPKPAAQTTWYVVDAADKLLYVLRCPLGHHEHRFAIAERFSDQRRDHGAFPFPLGHILKHCSRIVIHRAGCPAAPPATHLQAALRWLGC